MINACPKDIKELYENCTIIARYEYSYLGSLCENYKEFYLKVINVIELFNRCNYHPHPNCFLVSNEIANMFEVIDDRNFTPNCMPPSITPQEIKAGYPLARGMLRNQWQVYSSLALEPFTMMMGNSTCDITLGQYARLKVGGLFN